MGLISRVSSRTYRESMSMLSSRIVCSRRFLNSVKTGGKRTAIPNAGYHFLLKNPIYEKFVFPKMPRRPLYWQHRYIAIGLIPVNLALSYGFMMGEDSFNELSGLNQTTGCYAMAYAVFTTTSLIGIAFGCV